MRRLVVRHITVYRYREPVELGEHRMMFRPRESHDLRIVDTRLEISPPPATLRWLHDIFDNSVAVATFTGETTELRFASTLVIDHMETPLPDYALDPEAQSFPFSYSDEDRSGLTRGLERHSPGADVDRWAANFVPAAKSIETMALLRAMTLGIKKQFSYVRRFERGVLTASETLKRGSGTCRDFALLMMEGVRSLGLAARFVSGYILVPQDEPDSMSTGNTHAWLQVYLPGAGWVDFDPTNSIIGNRNLIRVAVAWDPAHALPLWGTYTGYKSSFLGMDVAVTVTDETVIDDISESEVSTC